MSDSQFTSEASKSWPCPTKSWLSPTKYLSTCQPWPTGESSPYKQKISGRLTYY